MCDEWMPHLRYHVTADEFRTLPRHPAYKYEYSDGAAYLTPHARHFHAELDLAGFSLEPRALDGIRIRAPAAGDRPGLERIFACSFDAIQPFGSLTDERRLEAAHVCLEKTWSGGDGPLVAEASFVAALADGDHPIGAILVTLLPGGEASDWSSFYWAGLPPADCIDRKLAQPHVTWIFVGRAYAGSGIATVLLGAAVEGLRRLGYATLWTTFMEGNVSSMLWHWRRGFRLIGQLRRG